MARPLLDRRCSALASKAVAVVVAVTAVTGVGGTAASAASTTPGVVEIRSGLPWASGVYVPGKDPAPHASFAAYRGADTDVVVTWPARESWTDLTNATWMYDAWKRQPQTAVYGFPPIPEDGVSTLAACASGAYDAHWRSIGRQLQATGVASKTILRLGWEFNGDWYAWAARKPAEFAECWRRIHRAADTEAPGLRWDWNVNRGISQIGIDPWDAYPGDAYVDIVGVDSYDWYPAVVDETSWQAHYAGAYGLEHWADFARSRGKRLSVPEWGVYPGTAAKGNSGGDNPYFIDKMLGFFYEQRDNLAYEAYFNTSAPYYAGSLQGSVQNPKASAEYAKQIRAYKALAAEPATSTSTESATSTEPAPASEPAPLNDVESSTHGAQPAPVEDTAPTVQVSVPRSVASGTGVSVSADVSVDRATTFARLPRIAIRDAAGASTDAQGGLDAAFGPGSMTGSLVLSGSRALAPGTYTAFVAYSLDGTTWLNGAKTPFVVPEPTVDTGNGVRVSAPRATTHAAGAALSADVATSKAVDFARLPRIAIRNSAGRSRDAQGGLDIAFGPRSLDGEVTLTGTRPLPAGTYTAFVAYSVDGSAWVHGPETTFTVR